MQPIYPFPAHRNLILHPGNFKGFMEIPYSCVTAFGVSSKNPIHLHGISYLISKRFALYFLLSHLHYLCPMHSLSISMCTASLTRLSGGSSGHTLPLRSAGFKLISRVYFQPDETYFSLFLPCPFQESLLLLSLDSYQ